MWRFERSDDGGRPQSRSTSPASEALSKELRKRGWKFVGPTTVYAFMQAMGLVNHHSRIASYGPRSKRCDQLCVDLDDEWHGSFTCSTCGPSVGDSARPPAP
ncbi:DNA-3-methyladenine glycosylase I [Ensifer sp. BR816]|uniref:DNA-3-methyladenine glycosylase I n=1 Tax=Rhizobium sp. (strain BR816) TaxID=1057002 RepID=UPI0035275470